MGFQVPYSYALLETTLQNILARGKDKLSDLFIVIRNDEEADFEKELPDKMIRDLRMNLRTGEFNKLLRSGSENLTENFIHSSVEIESQVDTNKIRVFFSRSVPKNVILSKRVFNYPRISTVSARPQSVVNGVQSHLKDEIKGHLEKTYPKEILN